MRKRSIGIVAGISALLVGSGFMIANAKPEASATTRPVRLTKPWSELKDLSDEQAAKIHAIHEKALGEMHEIETKEKADSMAVLTDAQKKELAEAIAEDKKEAAERRATNHPSASPATKPSK